MRLHRSLTMLPLVLVAVVTLMMGTGCRRSSKKWQIVTTPAGYQLSLPPDWTYKISSNSDIRAKGDPKKLYDLVALAMPLPHPFTYDEFAQQEDHLLSTLHPGAAGSAQCVFPGQMTGRKRSITAVSQSPQVKACGYTFINGGTAYLIYIFTAAENFPAAEPMFDTIARSFTLTKTTWHTVTSPAGYQLSLPPDWTCTPPTTSGDISAKDGAKMHYLEVSAMTSASPMTADELAQLEEQALRKDSFTYSASHAFTGKMIGRKRVVSAVIDAQQMKACYYNFIKGNTLYTLEITTPARHFAKAEPLFDDIARSLTLHGEGWQTVTLPAGYQLSLPPGWGYDLISKSALSAQYDPAYNPDTGAISDQACILKVTAVVPSYHLTAETCEQRVVDNMKAELSAMTYRAQGFSGKMKGRKLVISGGMKSQQLTMYSYSFINGRTLCTVVASTSAKNAAQLEPTFDKIARSFTLHTGK